MSLDHFSIAPDRDDALATLECNRCHSSVLVSGGDPVWGFGYTALSDLIAAAEEHDRTDHPDVLVLPTPQHGEERTAWMEGADGVVPWREDLTYAGGGALVHVPTASFRTCAEEWTEHRTSPEGARQVPIHHRCAMSRTRDHDWHRCACGGTAPATAPDQYARSADA